MKRAINESWTLVILIAAGLSCAAAADLGDPAAVAPPPPNAIGFPSRAADLDALPGFREPPPGYGEVAFFWWLGDPLTRERLAWEIDRLDEVHGVMGLQINYAHSDRGGTSYGLTYPSDPALFSEAWWDLTGWFMKEAKQHGMAVSLSDYTLGIGQGWSVDKLLARDPSLAGSTLQHQTRDVAAGAVEWTLPADTLMVAAYPLDVAGAFAGPAVDLRGSVSGNVLRWTAPGPRHRLVAVSARTVTPSLDPMNPKSGPAYADEFFGQFERRNPGESGRALNFFFSDELGFNVAGNLWTARFAAEFQKRKGYDLVPELPALFVDAGPRTAKVRLDYSDVKVALTEEGFFKPVFDWHQQRGMIYGCDHGGRGRNVTEFGDYFRTQRWNQGPGSDQPHLGRDLIKAKVAASIAHLYQRPRVWLEGYYSSGWGTSSEQIADATFANFARGYNLLTLHGLYYSLHGGYWEWAPPCNHFRMPYWAHMREFMACVQRLSYVLSQGDHRCDVAIVYPVAPVEAGLGGGESVKAAFDAATKLYAAGIDFDFIDFESVARAAVKDGRLEISGESYRALVLPAMRAARWSTLEKAAAFQRAGGFVRVLGAAPEASDRAGAGDPALASLVKELPAVRSVEDLANGIASAFPPDFALADSKVAPSFMHRRIGPRDLYMIYGAPKGTEVAFRATGRAELWDPWTGRTTPLPVLEQAGGRTRLALPLTEKEAQLVVFGPGEPERAKSAPSSVVETIPLEGEWDFELAPTLDNRWGDFRWPATKEILGAEARRFRTSEETVANPGWEKPGVDDKAWKQATASFGPMFWKLGPLPEGAAAELDGRLAALTAVDPAVPVEVGGKKFTWQPYEFSWRWGVEGDPGHQGYHGLKENITDHFICLGAPKNGKNETLYGPEPGGTRYYLWTTVPAAGTAKAHPRAAGLKPAAAWLNGAALGAAGELKPGANPLLLRYDGPGRGYFVFDASGPGASDGWTPSAKPASRAAAAVAGGAPFSAAANWIWHPAGEKVADVWFRKEFDLATAPGKARLRITCDNIFEVSINSQPVGSGSSWERVQEYDLTRLLHAGKNDIAVHGRSPGGPAGLIAEIEGDGVRLATDAGWRCAKTATDPAPVAAAAISPFAGSLWATHPQGPPRVEAAGQVQEPAVPAKTVAQAPEQPKFEASPLAMTWYGNAAILPYDPRPARSSGAEWFRFTAPPGLKAIRLPLVMRARVWVDGVEAVVRAGRAEVAKPTLKPSCVAMRLETARGEAGGAAIPEPLALECGPGRLAAGDWSAVGVLETYSGGAWYRRVVSLTKEQVGRSLTLDLGDLVSSAEVRVNGKSAGVRVAPPWRFELGGLVQEGDNRIEVLIYNTLGNHYSTIPTHYHGIVKSGLIGPVRIEMK